MVAKILIVVAFTLTVGDGCGGGPGDAPFQPGPDNVTCKVTVEHPHWSKGNPEFVVGKARITCTGAIDSLVVNAMLQRKDGLRIKDVGDLGDAKYTGIKPSQQYTGQSSARCPPNGQAHDYRTVGWGSGVFGGQPAKSMTKQYGKWISVQCA